MTRKSGTITLRALTIAREDLTTLGTKFLCSLFLSGLSEKDSSAGMRKITEIRLATMPLASAKPISTPMGSDMSASASKPAIVVSELESISTMPFESATESACLTSA